MVWQQPRKWWKSLHRIWILVSGYVSLPELTRAKSQLYYDSHHGRYIKNFLLNRAILTATQRSLRYQPTSSQYPDYPHLADVMSIRPSE